MLDSQEVTHTEMEPTTYPSSSKAVLYNKKDRQRVHLLSRRAMRPFAKVVHS
jgi:hypothetical protein